MSLNKILCWEIQIVFSRVSAYEICPIVGFFYNKATLCETYTLIVSEFNDIGHIVGIPPLKRVYSSNIWMILLISVNQHCCTYLHQRFCVMRWNNIQTVQNVDIKRYDWMCFVYIKHVHGISNWMIGRNFKQIFYWVMNWKIRWLTEFFGKELFDNRTTWWKFVVHAGLINKFDKLPSFLGYYFSMEWFRKILILLQLQNLSWLKISTLVNGVTRNGYASWRQLANHFLTFKSWLQNCIQYFIWHDQLFYNP